jgi:hypothetical protein
MQDGTVKGHIDGQATFLKRFLGDAKLQTEIEIAKNDVLQRYPRADALRINQYFLYVTCVYLMLDTKLTTPEKLRELRIMRETLSPAAVPVQPPQQAPPAKRPAKQWTAIPSPPASAPKDEKCYAYEAAIKQMSAEQSLLRRLIQPIEMGLREKSYENDLILKGSKESMAEVTRKMDATKLLFMNEGC